MCFSSFRYDLRHQCIDNSIHSALWLNLPIFDNPQCHLGGRSRPGAAPRSSKNQCYIFYAGILCCMYSVDFGRAEAAEVVKEHQISIFLQRS